MAKTNGSIVVKNGHLVIDIPLSKGTLSASGKNLVVATTNGFAAVEGSDVRVSLNAIRKA